MVRRSTLFSFGLIALWSGACRDSREESAPATPPLNEQGSATGPPRESAARTRSGPPERGLPELRAIGYSGWDEPQDDGQGAPASGVLRLDPAEVQDWVRVWADDASTVHRVLPSGERLPSIEVPDRTQVEFARVLEDGRLLCLSVDEGLTLLEPTGELVFHADMAAHHDVALVPDGAPPGRRTFAALVHRERMYQGRSVRFDGIALVSEATGRVVNAAGRRQDDQWAWDSFAHRQSLMEVIDGPNHALDQPAAELSAAGRRGNRGARTTYDYFHANALVFQGPHQVTVCLRNVDAIVSLDWPTGAPRSAMGPGILDWPHAPSYLEQGLLVFDNGKHRGWSRVVEISARTGLIRWDWRGPEDRPLWSEVRGFAQRLPCGNTLVTESERGRAMEVTQDGRVVWEFVNPESRPNGGKGAARRRIYRLMAFPGPSAPTDPGRGYLRGAADSGSGEDQSDPPR